MAAGIGYAVGPLLGGFLDQALGIHKTYLVCSVLPILLAIISFIFWRAYGVSGVRDDPLKNPVTNGQKLDFQAIKETFNMRIAIIIASCCLMAASFAFLDLSLVQYLAHKVAGWNSSKGGIAITIPAVSYAIASKMIGKLIHVVGTRVCFCIGLILSGVSILALGPVPFLNVPTIR